MSNILQEVREKLKKNADEKNRASFQRFFKTEVKCYGVKTPIVKKIATECFRKIDSPQKKEIFSICETLYQSGLCEEAYIAATWVDLLQKFFVSEDIMTFERWIDRYIDDWAKCDTFCTHAVGSLIMKFPELIHSLNEWTASSNPFLRRASAVSLIIHARKGLFLDEIFHIANALLLDEHDLVQKGYGWMLKEASRKHQEEVFSFVLQHKHNMPRTALRYAIEKMPQELRKQAMDRRQK